jgi:hypothetical protein
MRIADRKKPAILLLPSLAKASLRLLPERQG